MMTETKDRNSELPVTDAAKGRPFDWGRRGAGRVLVVVNPASGEPRTAAAETTVFLNRVEGAFSVRGVRSDRLVFQPERFAQALREQLTDDLLAIFVLGGDGTVLALAEALQDHPVPIGILPSGTVNWLARDLGIPADPVVALDRLSRPDVRLVDVAQVNGRPFLCACMVGVAALLARVREHHRHAPRWRRWPTLFLAALSLWRRYPHLRLALVIDGQRAKLRSRTVVVVNNRIERALRLIPYRARLDQGELDIYAMRRATPRRLRAVLGNLISGAWRLEDAVLNCVAAEVTLEVAGHRSLPVLLDGELRSLQTPLRFGFGPRALPFLIPGAAEESQR